MPGSSSSGPRILYWFRTDLRLHDSPALTKALSLNPSALFPLFCFDPNYIYKHRVGINRMRFLLESLQDLSDEIKKVNGSSQLLLVRGEPQTRLKEICEKWQITHIAFEEDLHAYSVDRDAAVRESLKKANVEVVSEEGRHLYPIKEVLNKHKNEPCTSMSSLQSAISSLGAVAKPADAPNSLPDPSPPGSDKADVKKLWSLLEGLDPYAKKPGPPKVDLNSADMGGQRQQGKDGAVTAYDSVAHADKDPFAVPTLAELGMKAPEKPLAEPIKGGTKEALRRLDEICKDPAYLATFAKPKTSPSTDPDAPSTTMLSPYIKFGCLGIRHLWHKVKETKGKYKGSKTDIPEGMEGQLLFRDMYAVCEAALGSDFEHIRNNKICRFMDWYLPTAYDKDGNKIEPRPKGDDVSEARLEAFKAGTTGFPWIDALMRQLRQTGWIHHLGRHSVAAFLTRGQCWISWERGAEIFDEYLIDWDPASNSGNWMWLSASAFFHQFFRVYSPVTFAQKYDKTGHIIRKYCPELKDYPDKFIFNPWQAPIEVQKKANCVIGKDYPKPMLDDKEEKQHCLDRCKTAYDHKFYGTSKEVLNGTAEGILRKAHGVPDPKTVQETKGDKIPAWAKMGAEANTGTSNGKSSSSSKPKKEEAEETEEQEEEDEDEMQPHETDDHGSDKEEKQSGEKRKKGPDAAGGPGGKKDAAKQKKQKK